MDKAKEFLEKNICDEASIVVGVSGGPDSMCLLNLVCELKFSKKWQVIVAHVNHNLRKESKKEQEFVKNYCLKNNLIYETIDLDFQNKFNEHKGHQLRYAYFQNVLTKYQTKYLLLAHHGDDLIESILMRITRGSTLEGYLGFKKENCYENMVILRPLIFYSKKDILKYNKENKIGYKIDKSNNSNKHTRNRYRKYLLPFLQKEEKNINLKYLKFSEELEETQEFIDNYVDNLKVINENVLNLEKLKKESVFIKRKALEKLIKNIQKNDWLEIDNAKMDKLIEMFDGKNKQIDLNNDYVALKEYNNLTIKKKHGQNSFEYDLNSDIITDNWEIIYTKEDNDSNYCIRLNSKEISLPLKVRSRKKGDMMTIKNFNGHQKIKDIFINNKVNPSKRDSYPIVVDSTDKILWVPGLKKSKFAKKKQEIYDIILKYKVR